MNANPPEEQSIPNKQVFGVVSPPSVPSVRPGDQILHVLHGFPWTTTLNMVPKEREESPEQQLKNGRSITATPAPL